MRSNKALYWVAGLALLAIILAASLAYRYFTGLQPTAEAAPPAKTVVSAVVQTPPAAQQPAAAAAPPPKAEAQSPPAQPAPQTEVAAVEPPQPPSFDVVSVEPTGDAVVAGRAAPNAAIELRADGKVIAQASADDSGQFAILPPPLPPGDHSLQLASQAGAGAQVLS
ncbi:MAG TPA: Ig-like domain-containing protein, partial [Roseiarcus sp.]|nr:Ig-like domain-containing protein [Roseiarcus sp.]